MDSGKVHPKLLLLYFIIYYKYSSVIDENHF